MPKRPTINLTTSGFMSAATLNANFTAIRDFFDNCVSRDGSAPNTMAGDLDMDDNDIINVGTIDIANLTVNQQDIGVIFEDTGNAGDINNLNLVRGDILYYDGTNIVRLAIGSNGQVLKVNTDVPAWQTDNDTVGVTVEEDDVSVQTNVTIINFVTGGAGVVSSPEAGVVEVDLDTFIA